MSWKLEVSEAKEDYLTETELWRYIQQFLMNATHDDVQTNAHEGVARMYDRTE